MSTSGHRRPAEDRRCYCLSSATSRNNIVTWHCLCCQVKDIHDVVIEGLPSHSLHPLLQPVKAGLMSVVTRCAELPFLVSSKSLDGRRNPRMVISSREPLRPYEVSHDMVYF